MMAVETPARFLETPAAPSVRGALPPSGERGAAAIPSLCLVVLDDRTGRAVSMVLLDDSRACYLVGRAARGGVGRGVDVGLYDYAVARRHCEVAWDPQHGWHVRDLHGGDVRVDGLLVPGWAPLFDGSVLTVGRTAMGVQLKGF